MTDLERTMRRARRAYEVGRLRRAFLGFLPALGIVLVACLLSDGRAWTLSLGLATFGVGTASLWRGQELKRAVLPGVVAGALPLVLVLVARRFGHLCTGMSCSTVCMEACAVGGVLAGLVVARAGNRRKSGPGFWLIASALAILTGAMSCACLGFSGILGLGLGYGGGLVPGLLFRGLRRPAP